MRSRLELRLDGSTWSGWKSVSVQQSLEAAASSFAVVMRTRDPWPARAGAVVEVLLEGRLVLTGYVDRVSPSLDDGGSVTAVEGRSRTADLVDCSALNQPGEWWNPRLQDLAAEIARPFGIRVADAIGEVERFQLFRIQPGETAFEAIERACRLRAVLLVPTAGGDLLLTRPSQTWEGAELREGLNVQAASFELDLSERFAEIVVRGQSFGSDETYGPPAAHIEGRARDLQIRAARRLLVVAEAAVSVEAAQARAEWEATVRAARSEKVSVSTAGWTSNTGALWVPNTRVQCYLPSVRLDGPLLVNTVRLSQDESGSRADLELVRPDAYLRQPDLEAEASLADLVEQEEE